MTKRLSTCFILYLFVLFISTTYVWAISDEYQNNLNNIDVKKNGDNSLDITIYTDTPYKEPLKVTKKSDTKYVLLLPETSNSTNNRNILKGIQEKTGGLVENVELKHYSYPTGNLGNGYTKVTITTNAAVGIDANAMTQQGKTVIKKTKKVYSQSQQPKVAEYKSVKAKKTNAGYPNRTAIRHDKASKSTTKQVVKTIKKKTTVSPQPKVKKQQFKPPVTDTIQAQIPAEQESNQPEKAEEILKPENSLTNAQADTIENLPELSTENTEIEHEEYNDAVDSAMREQQRENENIWLLFWLVSLGVIVYIFSQLKKWHKTKDFGSQKNVLPQRRTKQKINHSGYQRELINIIDNTNLSWQERYALLKKQDKNFHLNKKISRPKTEDLGQSFINEKISENSADEDILTKRKNTSGISGIQSKITSVKGNNDYACKDNSLEYLKKNKIQGHINLSLAETKNKANSAPQMISQVKITENKGFYITRFENETFLIGYVGENVFVLKNFGDVLVTNLKIKVNETKNDSTVFLVQTGSYRALIDVSDKMKMILEL